MKQVLIATYAYVAQGLLQWRREVGEEGGQIIIWQVGSKLLHLFVNRILVF